MISSASYSNSSISVAAIHDDAATIMFDQLESWAPRSSRFASRPRNERTTGQGRPRRRRCAANIGAATAIRLAEEGTSVVAADLNESAARAVGDEIQALGGKAIGRSFDISDESSYKELFDVTTSPATGVARNRLPDSR
jgi:hypothetical protein